MDSIRFIRKQANEGFEVIGIEINGVPLADMARTQEQPFADAEGRPKSAGGYDGMTPSELLSDVNGLGGIESSRTVQVMQCDGCYEPGCKPLDCRVEVQPDRVIWEDFDDHGNDRRAYDGFGPFVFPRAECEAALAAIATGRPRP